MGSRGDVIAFLGLGYEKDSSWGIPDGFCWGALEALIYDSGSVWVVK